MVCYRRATSADIEAEHAIFCRAEGRIVRARGYDWADPPLDRFSPGLRHLLANDPARCWVAEADDRVVGFTGAFVRDDTWFFSMLFIDPDFQGRHVGRDLFRLAAEGAPPRRLTITDSIQPVSNALYGRHGLLPIAPLIPLAGTAHIERPSGLDAADPSRADLAIVDRAAYGFDRALDHAWWVSQKTRRGWYRDGQMVAWSYRTPSGYIGPLAGIDAASAAAALAAELHSEGAVSVEIPASARTLLSMALDSGLHIEPPIGLLLASEGVAPPSFLTISSYGFF
jgi:GNAT superfamily N-acetyltransferase